jgi:hypothetical protein
MDIVAEFADRVTLQVQAGTVETAAPRFTGRSSSRSAARTAATAGAAVT